MKISQVRNLTVVGVLWGALSCSVCAQNALDDCYAEVVDIVNVGGEPYLAVRLKNISTSAITIDGRLMVESTKWMYVIETKSGKRFSNYSPTPVSDAPENIRLEIPKGMWLFLLVEMPASEILSEANIDGIYRLEHARFKQFKCPDFKIVRTNGGDLVFHIQKAVHKGSSVSPANDKRSKEKAEGEKK